MAISGIPGNTFSNITTTVQSVTTSIALVTPQTNVGYQPISTYGPGQPATLLFHTEGENVAQIQSDITDHYIEDNTAIQDQIALKPEMVTVHGFIGELNDVFPVANVPNNGQINAILPPVTSFVTQFTTAGQALINTAAAGYQTQQAAANAVASAQSGFTNGNAQNVVGSSGSLSGGSAQGLQQAMFQQFYLYWRNRVLFKVQTPWAVFSNMAIMELRATQDESTRMITDFYISFKMLRFSTTTEVNGPQAVGGAYNQRQAIVSDGNSNAVSSSQTAATLASNLG